MNKILYTPIGIIHTPFHEPQGMPIQPVGAEGIRGTVQLFPEYQQGLQDLAGFSHILLLYHFHRAVGFELLVTPFLDEHPRGLFATRAPRRPNPLGISVVRLLAVEGNLLQIANLDILDGTPLLDIKPFTSEFDHHPVERSGWLQKSAAEIKQHRSDDRFR